MRIDRLRRGSGGPASRQVYRALRDAIISTALAPGQRISENELAERLAVSRTPVREALIRLRDERFVQIVPQLGTFVTRISSAAVEDAQFIRESLECAAVRLAAARADAGDGGARRGIVRRQAEVSEHGDHEHFAVLDDEFHAAICELAGHSVAWEVAQRVKGHLNRVRRLSLPQPRYLAEMVAEHRLVLEALAAGRPRRGRGNPAPPPAHGPVGAARDPRTTPRLLRGGAPLMAIATATLRELFEQMLLIRAFETEAERQYKAARIGGYCHLSSGQEAATVGATHALGSEDLLVTGYRCHGFALARGVPPEAVMAELFGRVGGCAHGRGGSMHLLDVGRGYYGGWGIVAGQLPIATGLALGLVRQERRHAVLCELGDGAINMGAWHESLNLAAVWRLPVVFLVMNNEYGMGTSVERASAVTDLYRRAAAYDLPAERVDGDDLLAVAQASATLLDGAREERQPAVLELVTYRYRGHSVADAGLAYRTRGEIDEHIKRDPIFRVRELLAHEGVADAELDRKLARAEERVAASVEAALASPAPEVGTLARGVYAPGSAAQFARMLPGAPFGERELVFAGGLGE